MLVLDTEKVKVLFERTLSLAKKGWGTTHPNPMVGALIVEGGEVVSEGYHVKTGHAHAEAQQFQILVENLEAMLILYLWNHVQLMDEHPHA